MKASKDWGACSCDCGQNIGPGSEMIIVDGQMYLLGHEERKTRQMQAIGGAKKKKAG